MVVRLKFSSRRKVPLIDQDGLEFLPWQLGGFFKMRMRRRWVGRLGFDFEDEWWTMAANEWEMWKQFYLPPVDDYNSLVADIGAGCGETILFYYLHGFRRFLAVEPDARAYRKLLTVARKLSGASIIARCKVFSIEDLTSAGFAKIDCEGGEDELLRLNRLPCAVIVEIHSRTLERSLVKRFPELKLCKRITDEVSLFRSWS